MARSSSDQCEIGRPNSDGLVVARTTTLCRSSGGKSPRSTAAREVSQAVETVVGEAGSPLADRGRVAAELGGDGLVGRAIRLATAEDETTAKGLRLGGRVGVDDLVEPQFFFAGEADKGGASGHGAPSLVARGDLWEQGRTTRPIERNPPASLQDQVCHYLDGLVKLATSPPSGRRGNR